MIKLIPLVLLTLPVVSMAQVSVSADEQIDDAMAESRRLYQEEEYKKSLIFAEQAFALEQGALPESSKKFAEVTFIYGDALPRVRNRREDGRKMLSSTLTGEIWPRNGTLPDFSDEGETVALYRTAPRYPTQARVKGIAGYVDLKFSIDKQGFVKNPVAGTIEGSEEFIAAALTAMKHWRYTEE